MVFGVWGKLSGVNLLILGTAILAFSTQQGCVSHTCCFLSSLSSAGSGTALLAQANFGFRSTLSLAHWGLLLPGNQP